MAGQLLFQIFSSPKVEGYDSATFIVKEKCVTANSSKQAELCVLKIEHSIPYIGKLHPFLYSRQLLWLWTKLLNGMILVCKKKKA